MTLTLQGSPLKPPTIDPSPPNAVSTTPTTTQDPSQSTKDRLRKPPTTITEYLTSRTTTSLPSPTTSEDTSWPQIKPASKLRDFSRAFGIRTTSRQSQNSNDSNSSSSPYTSITASTTSSHSPNKPDHKSTGLLHDPNHPPPPGTKPSTTIKTKSNHGVKTIQIFTSDTNGGMKLFSNVGEYEERQEVNDDTEKDPLAYSYSTTSSSVPIKRTQKSKILESDIEVTDSIENIVSNTANTTTDALSPDTNTRVGAKQLDQLSMHIHDVMQRLRLQKTANDGVQLAAEEYEQNKLLGGVKFADIDNENAGDVNTRLGLDSNMGSMGDVRAGVNDTTTTIIEIDTKAKSKTFITDVPLIQRSSTKLNKPAINPLNKTLEALQDYQATSVDAQRYPGMNLSEPTALPRDLRPDEMIHKTLASFQPAFKRKWGGVLLSKVSQDILKDFFWYVFLRRWKCSNLNGGSNQGLSPTSTINTTTTTSTTIQHNYEQDLKSLIQRMSQNYIQFFHTVLQTRNGTAPKLWNPTDDLFQQYPDILAHSAFTTFATAYPRSSSQIDNMAFKIKLCDLCTEWIWGVVPYYSIARYWDQKGSQDDIGNLISIPVGDVKLSVQSNATPDQRDHSIKEYLSRKEAEETTRLSITKLNQLQKKSVEDKELDFIELGLVKKKKLPPTSFTGPGPRTMKSVFSLYKNTPLLDCYFVNSGLRKMERRAVSIPRTVVLREFLDGGVVGEKDTSGFELEFGDVAVMKVGEEVVVERPKYDFKTLMGKGGKGGSSGANSTNTTNSERKTFRDIISQAQQTSKTNMDKYLQIRKETNRARAKINAELNQSLNDANAKMLDTLKKPHMMKELSDKIVEEKLGRQMESPNRTKKKLSR